MNRYMPQNKPQRYIKLLLSGCFVAVLAFLFAGKVFSTENQPQAFFKSKEFHAHSGSLPTHGHYQIPQRTNTHSLVCEHVAEPQEDTSVKDLELGTELNFFISVPLQSFSETLLSALPDKFLNTKVHVPLFILYHSWKTFIH